MITIFFFGNCQLSALKLKLNLDKKIYKIYSETCHYTKKDKNNFTNIIKKSDIIITQNISDNYRNVDYLNLNYILNYSQNKIIIIIPSCYFDFYYPDLKYIKKEDGNKLSEPIDYHYQYMINNYKNNDSIDNYIKNYVNNIDLISKEILLKKANDSIRELKIRTKKLKKELSIKKQEKNIIIDNIHIICISKFIKKNYKDKLLFYSMNHPSKYIFNFISTKIIKLLNIKDTIKYKKEVLNGTKCILYKCIQPLVNFDISKEEIKTKNLKDIYLITKLYHNTYNKLQLEIS